MKKYFLIVFALTLMNACSNKTNIPDKAEATQIHSMGMNDIYIIPEQEIAGLKEQALWGNLQSDIRLYDYYNYVKNDYKQANYWLEIGIENGGGGGVMHDLAFNLRLDKENPKNILRAKYWITQAIKNKTDRTKYVLQDIENSLRNFDFSFVKSSEKKALLGSASSALKLADFYKNIPNAREELYWTRIAVQNGSSHSIHRLATILQRSSNPQDKIRALYWFAMEKKFKLFQ